jgi:hypothetical protein
MSIHLLNRWTAALGWVVLMLIVWTLWVPRPVSVTTFTLLGLTGLLVLIAGTALRSSSRPAPSMGRILGDSESDRSTATATVRGESLTARS